MTGYIKSIRKLIGQERLLIVGGGVLVHKDGKLLFQKRKDSGCWSAEHGGCCELGETVEETARRELYEETGLTAHSMELFGVFSGKDLFYTYPNGDMASIVSIMYICDDFSGELIRQTEETTDLQWFGLDELPENIQPTTIPSLNRCVEVLREMYKLHAVYEVLPLDEAYRERVNSLIKENWSGPYIVTKGILRDTRTHAGFVAAKDGDVAGYILYHMADTDCEITVLESLLPGRGIGSKLIDAVVQEAEKAGCRRIWLITTNDNTNAIRFYQRYGFVLKEVHIDTMDKARKLKPQIPATGIDGIPIAHEFEFELMI